MLSWIWNILHILFFKVSLMQLPIGGATGPLVAPVWASRVTTQHWILRSNGIAPVGRGVLVKPGSPQPWKSVLGQWRVIETPERKKYDFAQRVNMQILDPEVCWCNVTFTHLASLECIEPYAKSVTWLKLISRMSAFSPSWDWFSCWVFSFDHK